MGCLGGRMWIQVGCSYCRSVVCLAAGMKVQSRHDMEIGSIKADAPISDYNCYEVIFTSSLAPC